ncbi:23S rRNA (adenine(2030)-N(6))-methyltransferase RlmJ [Candidatus Fukatsuia symbiotica]|uniref:Ribosomal RNA large subunit methyltransferase J n=1 Tax=Candidatus Fukatsuia symbiotica TaxID=1878942 RepID=A0A2U8I7T0_9GAMM|nr:23S rRNA (adenine(2030)-N(6))-methyltransferase RlmJ [Candidatus Fukatsuia symbiotica]AWK15153.1 23S rRNA (adenine(2030)-N(6))-methyltransferase RlmJ [Candidatus Fukatsuia symbiotica]MEA9443977.1 23S rRNA (adenine(2030)-N(6))-methyltransferase RlmJ [Candidatus Fukatsuia symbiotica]
MLSYRHCFHAGNHADVLKHSVQSLIIESLKEKEKRFFYLDTHAGAGRYQLGSEHAERTPEYLQGIAKIWQADDLPAEIIPYLNAVRALNQGKKLRYYPGSPLIAQHLLRSGDKMHLTELHPGDYKLLRNELSKNEHAKVQRVDGYQQLKAKLPPLSRRGFILMDPSYEIKDDYQRVVKNIEEGYRRFATGIYALWYPVVLRQQIKKMMGQLKDTGITHILQIELGVLPDSDRYGMTASGMIVINPPWKLEQQMAILLPWLRQVLVPAGYGHILLKWLVPE